MKKIGCDGESSMSCGKVVGSLAILHFFEQAHEEVLDLEDAVHGHVLLRNLNNLIGTREH